MTDLNAEVPSTVIDVDAPAPGAAEYKPEAVTPEPEAPKPMALEDAINKAVADTKNAAQKEAPKDKAEPVKAKEPKPEAEPKTEKVTPERGENGKFKPKETPETPVAEKQAEGAEVEQGRDEPRPSEGRDINRAPARFLPRAQEAWATVNPDVKAEVHRALETMQKGLDEGAEDRQYRKELREFDDMAKGAGTTVKAALANYVGIDNLLKTNPVAGIERILKSINVTPQQYAQHVFAQDQQRQQNPQAYASSQEAQQLKQQNELLQQQVEQANQRAQEEESRRAAAEVERTLFAEVRQDHPRFDELRPIVLKVWNSDLLPSNMNERDKLYAAVDYAERLNPVGDNTLNEPLNPAPNAQRPLNPAGTKSVKGSLSYGAEVPRKSAKVSLDEALKLAARSVG